CRAPTNWNVFSRRSPLAHGARACAPTPLRFFDCSMKRSAFGCVNCRAPSQSMRTTRERYCCSVALATKTSGDSWLSIELTEAARTRQIAATMSHLRENGRMEAGDSPAAGQGNLHQPLNRSRQRDSFADLTSGFGQIAVDLYNSRSVTAAELTGRGTPTDRATAAQRRCWPANRCH